MDYGHTFSKIIEMLPGADIMHGEAVNVDGFLCLVIAKRRGMISDSVLNRVFRVMKSIGLPTIHEGVELALMVKVSCTNFSSFVCHLTNLQHDENSTWTSHTTVRSKHWDPERKKQVQLRHLPTVG